MKTMTTEIFDLDQTLTEQTSFGTESVRREAFYLESQGQPLFAWLHHRAEGDGRRTVAVSVTTTGRERRGENESFRFLPGGLKPHGGIVTEANTAPLLPDHHRPRLRRGPYSEPEPT